MSLRVALAQLDLTVGALAENRERIAQACKHAAKECADLVLAPELALSGYPPEDLAMRPAFLEACMREAEALAREVEVPVLVGCPWLDGDRVRNAALLLAGGTILARYDKRMLPNYGVFDEERTFAPGRSLMAFECAGATCAVTICEDMWLADGPASEAAARGATVILNISASPYELGKAGDREQMFRTRARDMLCHVVFCNLVGGQDELVFDGHSCVIGPDGEVIARAKSFDEDLLVCDLDIDRPLAARLRDSRVRRGPRRRDGKLDPVGELGITAPDRESSEPRLELPHADELDELWQALRTGLGGYVRKNGFERVVLGLSGGIDSALVAALAADTLGADQVEAVSMPTRFNAAETRSDAQDVAERLGIGFREVGIEHLREAFHAAAPGIDGLAAENLQARIRAVLLMALSNQHGWLVLTTGNKSETAVGYSTLYGDTAGGFAPIKDLPKTLVFALAARLNARTGRELIPRSVIDRPPTAELRDGQRDDQSLPPYAVLDPIVEAIVEADLSVDEIVAAGLADVETARRIAGLIDRAEHKRRQAPPGIKLHPRAFGRDRRVPITNRYRA